MKKGEEEEETRGEKEENDGKYSNFADVKKLRTH